MSKGFVFSVNANGVCFMASAKSGRKLSGGALKACERSVLSSVLCSVRLPAELSSFNGMPEIITGPVKCLAHGRIVSRVLAYRRSKFAPAIVTVRAPMRRLWKSTAEEELALLLLRVRNPRVFHSHMFRPDFRWAFVGCGSLFSRHIASCRSAKFGEGWRRLRVRSTKFLVWVPRRVRFGSVSLGSGLLLTNENFLRSVASGVCPVRLSLSSYRWPVRSAVLGSLLACTYSENVCSVLEGEGFRFVLSRFVKAALRSLGFTGFVISRSIVNKAALYVSSRTNGLLWPEFPIVRVSSKALFAAFVALSRCLDWLCAPVSGGRGCPSSLRPLLCALVLSLLPIVGKHVLR